MAPLRAVFLDARQGRHKAELRSLCAARPA